MKRKVFVLVLVVVAVALFFGYREWNRTNADLKKATPEYRLQATALIAAFARDTASANKQYTDAVIEVSGTVKSIDAAGNPVVIALGQLGEMSSVQCSMDSVYVKEYNNIKEGDQVSLKGMCTGGKTEELFGTDVLLNRCVVSANR